MSPNKNINIDDNIEYDGELELEQAYINYHSGSWGFKGGVLLAPIGIINPYHEPPTFLSVERPAYAKHIIPTTWFGNGFSFYGNIGDIGLEITMLEDLNGANILNTKSISEAKALILSGGPDSTRVKKSPTVSSTLRAFQTNQPKNLCFLIVF